MFSINSTNHLMPLFRKNIIRLAALPLLLSMASTASAINVGFVYWQSNGGGCVPTDLTIKNNQYWTVTGAGRVKYKGSGTQPLVFSCPVSSISNVSGGDGTVLRLFYQDPDGPGADFKVRARLMSFNKLNGALTSQVCSVTSDTAGQWQSSSGVCGNIDIANNLYWVEVVISRTLASNLVVEFNGVSLEGAIF